MVWRGLGEASGWGAAVGDVHRGGDRRWAWCIGVGRGGERWIIGVGRGGGRCASGWAETVGVVHRGGERRIEGPHTADPGLTPGARTALLGEVGGAAGCSTGAAQWAAHYRPLGPHFVRSWGRCSALPHAALSMSWSFATPRRAKHHGTSPPSTYVGTTNMLRAARGVSPFKRPAAPLRSLPTVRFEPHVSTWGRRVAQPRTASPHPDPIRAVKGVRGASKARSGIRWTMRCHDGG